MQRRYSPLRWSDSVLLYGFGLALALSLLFNGFLLYQQSHHPNIYDYDLGSSTHVADQRALEQQASDCKQADQQKDTRIGGSAASPIRADINRISRSGSHRAAH